MNETGGLGASSIEISEWMLVLLALGFIAAVVGVVKLVKMLWATMSG